MKNMFYIENYRSVMKNGNKTAKNLGVGDRFFPESLNNCYK